MIIEDGDIVWSKAGHDKGDFFVVIKSDERFCWIANGRSRKLEAPKKKNRIHLSATNKKVDLRTIKNDCHLRKALSDFNS